MISPMHVKFHVNRFGLLESSASDKSEIYFDFSSPGIIVPELCFKLQ